MMSYTIRLSIAIVLAMCLTATVSANGRKLSGSKPGGATGGNNVVRSKALGTTYQVEGDLNLASAAATSDAIANAYASGRAFMASKIGSKAALSTSDRTVNIKTFDTLGTGGRKLLQSAVDRGDRISMALQAAHSTIDRAVNSANVGNSVKAATKNSLTFAKLSVAESTRAEQINDDGNRKL